MTMPQQTWCGAAARYLGMWLAMMVPMMAPSLVPMLARYRRSVRGADGIHLHGLAVVGVGWDGGSMAAGRGRRGASRGGRRASLLVEGAAALALPRRVRVRLAARARRHGRVAAWPQAGRAVQPLP